MTFKGYLNVNKDAINMKFFLSLINILSLGIFISSNTYAVEKYDSVVVVGHLYPLYKIYAKTGNYTNFKNLTILSNSLNNLSNVKKIVFLGDTYIDHSDKTYDQVKKNLLDTLKFPFIKINGNHETMNLNRFYQSGGKSKHYIDVGKFRLIMFSPWVLNKNTLLDTPIKAFNQKLINEVSKYLEMEISNTDLEFFKDSLSTKKKNIILITDMVHHKNSRLFRWHKDVVPILKNFNVDYVVVGDNDSLQHRFSWVNLNEIYYIHQGIANNSLEPGINTYLEIRLYHDGKIKFIPHIVPFDALADVYRIEDDNFKIEKKKFNPNFSKWREFLRLGYSMFIN
jgi:hypothetical protein